MLTILYNEVSSVMRERQHPANGGVVYSGYGTLVELLIEEYLDLGGSPRLLRKVLRLAEKHYG